MMTLPFFICAIALFTAWRGYQSATVILTVIAVIAVFVLFKMHATDVLNIDL